MSKEYVSLFGNKFEALPQVKIGIINMSVYDGRFSFTYEIDRDLGFKDYNGKKKVMFKHTFSPNTQFLEEKWKYLESFYKTHKPLTVPFIIKEVNGNKYLNLILKNEYFEKIKNQKVMKKREEAIRNNYSNEEAESLINELE